MNKIDIYTANVNEMEIIIEILAQTQPKPTFSQDTKEYEYEDKHKNIELMVFLKIVRLVKLLYGSIKLLKDGNIMAAFMICRAIGEDNEDITFVHLVSKLPNSQNHTKDQKKFLDLRKRLIGYFFDTPNMDVKRGQIRDAIDHLQIENLGLSNSDAAKRLYSFNSTFVHSKSIGIIRTIYNETKEKYDMIEEKSLLEDCIEIFSNYIFRVIASLAQVCEILVNNNLVQKSYHLLQNFADNPNLNVEIKNFRVENLLKLN